MKTLFVVILVTVSLASKAFSAVECERVAGERGMRPKNELAISIATKLGVKTCNGARFQKVVKALGETSNVEASKKSYTVEEVTALLKK